MAMAAASLGCTASRIGRSTVEQGRRLFYTRARTLTADEKTEVAARLSHIRLKKEQLYDLIAECEKKYPKSAPHNIQLLEHISKQIQPRGDDSLWRSCRRRAIASFCNELAGQIFLGTLTAGAITYSYQKMYPGEGNNDKKMVMDGGLKTVLPS